MAPTTSHRTGERDALRLARLVERAVAEACGLPRPGWWFAVESVAARTLRRRDGLGLRYGPRRPDPDA